MSLQGRCAIALALAGLALSGCITVSREFPYPSDWAPPARERIGGCPSIAGRYESLGRMHLLAGASCDPKDPAGGAARTPEGLWNCSLRLPDNLGVQATGDVVTLSQPDDATLVVGVGARDQAPALLQSLRRGHDFQCDAESLFFTHTRSLLGGPGATALGVLLLSGGVGQHSRAFVRNESGELVMTVRQSAAGRYLLTGFTGTATNHVRWRPAGTPADAGRAR